jgi:DNA-binding NarL/FixJ family response regulator
VHGQPIVLAGLAGVLVGHTDMAVVAMVETVSELLDGGVPASVVLLDADLDAGKALGCNVRRLDERGYGVLAGSAEPSRDQALAAFDAGARGYITTTHDLEQLALAIREVAAGRRWVSPHILPSLGTESPALTSAAWGWALGGREPETDALGLGLSGRELETVALYSLGIPRKVVAHRLGIEPETVKEYVKRARRKLEKAGRPAPKRIDLFLCLLQAGYPFQDLSGPGLGAEASSRVLVA